MERFTSGMDYRMIHTPEGMSGGMTKRQQLDQKIIGYFGVSSVLEISAKVEKLGGKILVSKVATSMMDYFAACMDTECNAFGLYYEDHP